ncbi:MAG: radical SAM family heme chaperone HemW [Deltaproteobacteria bacterium]|nr:radical SAM family heme chaperone HemW [Deltaproteobacteria bacterium]
MNEPAGLYVHIPFCKSKCGYCNFYSIPSTADMPFFINALSAELKMYAETFSRFDTLYIGGGTPSLLAPIDLARIISELDDVFAFSTDSEVTLEVNSADCTPIYLRGARRMGINRLNIGVQAFDGAILDFLERRHSPEQSLRAFEIARGAGFDNIGLDLIYGIPGQEMESWLAGLDLAVSLNVEHLSCYQLTLEPGTPLGKRHADGEFALPDGDRQAEFFLKTSKTLEDSGYIHYEVSNFARNEGLISRHNSKYWDHTPYLGLGPSAHSFQDNRRWENHPSLPLYLEEIKMGKAPVASSETLTGEELQLESLYLGLRTKKGIHLEDFKKLHGYDLMLEKGKTLAALEKEGLVEVSGGYLRPTRAGLAVADSLALI